MTFDMNRAFTLLELLVVVAIMGLLGTTAVGGYTQMQRGMEERRVVDDATKFLSLAAERARIDGKKVIVYYWNELLREEQDDETAVVVGRAVAVRTCGRITRKAESCLIDEYGDLEQFLADGTYETDSADDKSQKLTIYPMDGEDNQPIAVKRPRMVRQQEVYLSSNTAGSSFKGTTGENEGDGGKLLQFGYETTGSSGSFNVGTAYGMEFQQITLPHGYLFGSDVPSSINRSLTTRKTLVFRSSRIGELTGDGQTLPVYALRQASGGGFEAKSIGSAEVEKN